MSEQRMNQTKNVEGMQEHRGADKQNRGTNHKNGQRKNGQDRNRNKKQKTPFAHKGMYYLAKDGSVIHEWNCAVLRASDLQDFDAQKDVELLTGCLCEKCGRSLLLKKYTEDKEEGRALSKFLGEQEISTEFLCELYEVYRVFPYVYNQALKLFYKDKNWKLTKEGNKIQLYQNEFGENMPGWFNDYWVLSKELEEVTIEEAIKVILTNS